CSEELEVAEEAAKVALSESILLQRKLCEICRHLEVRAAFEESIQKAPDFECNRLDLRLTGPPPSSRSTVYDHSRGLESSSNTSVDSQACRAPPPLVRFSRRVMILSTPGCPASTAGFGVLNIRSSSGDREVYIIRQTAEYATADPATERPRIQQYHVR
ncbi:hypothetical protein FOZ62_013657, partial [Perkinsus olseni]